MRSLNRTLQERYLRGWRFQCGLERCPKCCFDWYDTKLGECRFCELSDQEAWAHISEEFHSGTYPPPMAT